MGYGNTLPDDCTIYRKLIKSFCQVTGHLKELISISTQLKIYWLVNEDVMNIDSFRVADISGRAPELPLRVGFLPNVALCAKLKMSTFTLVRPVNLFSSLTLQHVCWSTQKGISYSLPLLSVQATVALWTASLISVEDLSNSFRVTCGPLVGPLLEN